MCRCIRFCGLLFLALLLGASDVAADFPKRLEAEPSLLARGPGRVRKNINRMTASELASLKRGIAAMKALPASNPRSWRFHANIHGTSDAVPPNAVGLFNSCEHDTEFFFAWHRGYLFHLERILSELSGDPTLALPYWDWQTDPSLPIAFRNWSDATGANPLYDATRNINDGGALPARVVVNDTVTALRYLSYFRPLPSFSASFERSPHGVVHSLIGGNMSRVDTAAQDPIFFLHHANIDRNLDRWLNQGAGRGQPGDSAFLSRSYSFVDERGNTRNVQVRDILDSASLGYRYDDVPNPTPVRIARVPPRPLPVPRRMAASFRGETLPTSKQALGLNSLRQPLAIVPEQQAAWKALTLTPNSTGKVWLRINGIGAKDSPSFVYGISLNLPARQLTAAEQDLHYAGTLNFFGRIGGGHQGHRQAGEATSFSETFDVTRQLAGLQQAKLWQPDMLSVVFQPLTPTAASGNEAILQKRLETSAQQAEMSYQSIELLFTP